MKLNPSASGHARVQDSDPPRTLAAVELVVCAHPQVASLLHVAVQVESFLLSSAWTLEKASEHGFVRLLDRLLPLEWSGVSGYFRELRLASAVRQKTYPLDVLQWWMTSYLPTCKVETCTAPEHSNGVHFELYLTLWRWMSIAESQLYVEYAKWAIRQRHVCAVTGIRFAMDSVARLGLMEDIQWLHDQTLERCSHAAWGESLANDDVRVARWLYETYPDQYFDDPFYLPRCLEMVKWIIMEYKWKSESQRTAYIDRAVNNAIRRHRQCADSDEDILQFVQLIFSVRPRRNLSRNRQGSARWRSPCAPRLPTETMDAAASCGLITVVQWLHLNDTGGCTYEAMDQAATHSHLEVVQWLHVNRSGGCTTAAMDQAAANGYLAVIQWLHENRTEGCTTKAMNQAASNGHFAVVQWLHANRSEGCTTEAMDHAAAHGHLSIVQWLHANRSEGCTKEAMSEAIRNNNLEMVQWLHEHRTEGTTEAGIIQAASEGYLEMIQWVHANRPEQFIDESIDIAATHGQLEAVKWLHHNRSKKCTSKLLDHTAAQGHLNILKFLNTCSQCDWTSVALNKAIENGHSEVVTWLVERKPADTIEEASVRMAVQRGHLSILKILAPENIRLDSEFLTELGNYGRFETIEWILSMSLLSEGVRIKCRFSKQ